MKFTKGRQKPKGSGRQLGSLNKTTKTFKEAVTKLIEESQDHFLQWLSEISNPKDRLDVIYKFAEFVYPKISRLEHSGSIGQPLAEINITPEQRRTLIINLLRKVNGETRG